MTINDLINYVTKLDNCAEKFRLLDTLKMVRDHIPENHGKAYVVGMSTEDYKSWMEFKKFKEFTKRPSQA